MSPEIVLSYFVKWSWILYMFMNYLNFCPPWSKCSLDAELNLWLDTGLFILYQLVLRCVMRLQMKKNEYIIWGIK